MLGKILIVSSGNSQAYIEMERDAWLRHGFEVVDVTVEQAIHTKDFTNFYLIALVMDISEKVVFGSCMQIIQAYTDTPVVIFMAKQVTPEFEITALYGGADRVLPQSMDSEQCIANCVAIIRRYAGNKGKFQATARPDPIVLEYGGLTMNLLYWKVSFQGKDISLTPREYELLHLFVENKDQVLSYGQIYDNIWGDEVGVSKRTVSNLVSKLRNKLNMAPNAPNYIHNIRGTGYRFSS